MAGRRGSYAQAWRIELGMKMFPGQVNFPPLGARTRITSGTYDFGASASADGVGSCRARASLGARRGSQTQAKVRLPWHLAKLQVHNDGAQG